MYSKFSPYKFTSKCVVLVAGLILSVAVVFASSGGGNGKKSTQSTKHSVSFNLSTKAIAPFRATEMNFSQKKSKDVKFVGNLKMNEITTVSTNTINQNTVITQNSVYKYKVGNTIYLVPNKTTYKVSQKNNITAIDFRIAL